MIGRLLRLSLEDSKLTLVPSPRLGQSKTQPTQTTYRKKRILTSVTCGERFDLSCNQEMSINSIMIQFSACLVPHIAVSSPCENGCNEKICG